MIQSKYKFWNNVLGWSIFLIAIVTFGLTVEPTSSYWDASEYISTAAKIQVGHPPGAPLFQMVGAFFAMFALDVDKIALMVNSMSVISSAFTVLFLFWTITIILRKLPAFVSIESFGSKIALWGSATIGALAFCFCDSFWFSAVEAEVYAMAMFFLALLVWLGLRWETEMNSPRGNKWLLLMSFVIGLSFGVHFMALLAIPTLGMVYFFKKFPNPTWKEFLVANIVSVTILLLIFKFLLPNALAFFGRMEVFFVNNLGLPFNSGTIFAAFLIIGFFVYGLKLTSKRNLVHLNTGILCVLFVLVGFSCWMMIPIRAHANTIINQNDPSDARTLLAYYRMEQYPDTYLFQGPMFSDMYAGQNPVNPYRDDKPKYEKDKENKRYVIVNNWEKSRLNHHPDHIGLLPRLWSSQNASNYMDFIGPLKFSIKPEYMASNRLQDGVLDFRRRSQQGLLSGSDYHDFFRSYGRYLDIKKPSLLQNVSFLFNYQMGYMYWRYFMWNFTGRQNDLQGDYSILKGNWISGIPFVDKVRLGNQSNLDQDSLDNKARNTYYFLPLLVGILGFIFLYNQDRKVFWKLLLLFLFTGLVLKVYLNERPFEPRERDYALVGSFYVFTIGIALGTYFLSALWSKYRYNVMAPLTVGIVLLCVPVLMGFENWDDHDRSNRYTAQSIARSYLNSIQQDGYPMIFTIGDNDTFALWYAQEIEGLRTDIRTINTSLLATYWYIDQMKRKAYESPPIPSQLTQSQYAYGVREYIRFEPVNDSVRWDIKDFVNWVASDHPSTRYKYLLDESGQDYSDLPESQTKMIYYPTNKIRISVNKENVLKSGIVEPKDVALIVDHIDIDLPTSGLTKNQIMMLDIVANNDWKRPIYFTGGSFADSEYIWMKEYLELEGLVYKLVPIKTDLSPSNPYLMGRVDSQKMYDRVKQWEWGNSNRLDIYHDPETRKNSITYRSHMARLAEQLEKEGRYEQAEEIIDLALEKMPVDYFSYYSLLHPFINTYYKVGARKKARDLFYKVVAKYKDRLEYFRSLDLNLQFAIDSDIITEIERFRTCVDAVLNNADKEIYETALDTFQDETSIFSYHYGGDYDYYTMMEPHMKAYYEIGATEKARQLAIKISDQYVQRMQLYSSIPEESLIAYSKQLEAQLAEYEELVKTIRTNDSTPFGWEIDSTYQRSVSSFQRDEVQSRN